MTGPVCAWRRNRLAAAVLRVDEKALIAVIQEAYTQGISTRSVDGLVKAIGMELIVASQHLDFAVKSQPGS